MTTSDIITLALIGLNIVAIVMNGISIKDYIELKKTKDVMIIIGVMVFNLFVLVILLYSLSPQNISP